MTPILGQPIDDQPWRVTAKTDWEDFRQQTIAAGGWLPINCPYENACGFYRVETD